DNEEEHDYRSDESELFANNREDVIVVGLGQPRPLCLRVAKPDAEDSASRESPGAVHRLPADVHVVLRRTAVKPRIDALGAARAHEGEHDAEHGNDGTSGEE